MQSRGSLVPRLSPPPDNDVILGSPLPLFLRREPGNEAGPVDPRVQYMHSGKLQFLKLAHRDYRSYNCTLAPLTVVFVIFKKQCSPVGPRVQYRCYSQGDQGDSRQWQGTISKTCPQRLIIMH